ncbi:serine hydrolase domain-containing protein [Streptomyces sporangiiformans]|uniref:Beta-lactamase family protein n=1 Tax=Streptomyces sporangiiformans TaxID=2315329 RepID=A0A505DJ69_9ACTN|nr:serine hydrolase domain-containing protein [Streptomyces sporangiiformans]TPQ17471.1 beta-lactamase family protein [Streptomyces sporangiiformans]
MNESPLQRFITSKANEFGIPGSAVAVFSGGEESYAFHGTTSAEDTRPLDHDTLFHFGSITKTYTATAIMRLVADGKMDLDAPVRRYLPDFRLSDEDAAATVTMTHLLNHTGGWSDYLSENPEDSLERHVAGMADIPVTTPPGEHAAYKNAGFTIAGLIMESLTGMKYDAAMRSLVFDPVGLTTAAFTTSELKGHVALGHAAQADGSLDVTTDWVAERYGDPSGGIVSTIGDQLRWARFHLGDGEGVLPRDLLLRMQQPTTEVQGNYFGDGIGISWFLRTVDGVRTVGHGGSMSGQYSWLLLVPEKDFALVTVATVGPNGIPYNQDVVRWALETYLGVVDRDPEPLPFDGARARELVGTYETSQGRVLISTPGERLVMDFEVTEEALEVIGTAPDFPPSEFGLLADADDQYIVTDGPLAGMRGVFSRDAAGGIETINLAGRSYRRVT